MIDDARCDGPPLRHRGQCPTCGARRSAAVCHRCRSDLTDLVRIEQQADALRGRARQSYARGYYRQAAALADQAASLEASPDVVKLAACAHLLSGDFMAAWRAWVRTRDGSGR